MAGGEHALALKDLVEDYGVAREHDDGGYDDKAEQVVYVRVPILVDRRAAQAVEGGTGCCWRCARLRWPSGEKDEVWQSVSACGSGGGRVEEAWQLNQRGQSDDEQASALPGLEDGCCEFGEKRMLDSHAALDRKGTNRPCRGEIEGGQEEVERFAVGVVFGIHLVWMFTLAL